MSKKNPNNGSIANRIMKTSKAKMPRKRVEVPDWGETVVVRGISVEESKSLYGMGDVDPFERGVRTLLMVIEDENGTRIFDPNSEEQYDWLLKQPMNTVNPLLNALNELSGIDVEEVQKNLLAGQNTASSSSSQKSSE